MVGLIFRLSLKRGAIWLIGRRFSEAPLFGGSGEPSSEELTCCLPFGGRASRRAVMVFMSLFGGSGEPPSERRIVCRSEGASPKRRYSAAQESRPLRGALFVVRRALLQSAAVRRLGSALSMQNGFVDGHAQTQPCRHLDLVAVDVQWAVKGRRLQKLRSVQRCRERQPVTAIEHQVRR